MFANVSVFSIDLPNTDLDVVMRVCGTRCSHHVAGVKFACYCLVFVRGLCVRSAQARRRQQRKQTCWECALAGRRHFDFVRCGGACVGG